MNKLLTKFVLTPLYYVYFIGLMISAVFFNWRYAQENGFFKWLLLGEIVPTIQSTIWPYYTVKHFVGRNSGSLHEGRQQREMQLPQDGQVIASFKEKAWWLSEYAQLNAALDKAGGALSASYRVGPKGSSHVRVQLERGAGNSLNLILDLLPEALVSADIGSDLKIDI
ncbi:MAG: hypothetical protein FJ130_04940 [Deltaproteobacteria bacterium]|nr:hypothetical protein [Deltaproteobacteria bacterium]